MDIRKIAAAAVFATGAALAFAPLAAATPVDPTLVTDTLDSEIASQNSLFEFDALLAGDSADITKGGAGVFDTFTTPADLAKDAPTTAALGAPTTLESELYGVNPIAAGISSDTGPFSEFNGAVIQFDNAYNVELYSLANGTLDTNLNDYLFNGTIQTVLATQGETTTAAFDTLYNHAIGDLSGFFQTNLSFLDIPTPVAMAEAGAAAAPVEITSTVAGEVSSLNSMFEFDALLAGVPAADIVKGSAADPFDTIAKADIPAVQGTGTTPFDFLIYGVDPAKAGLAGDPGSFNLLNGAEARFDDAFNVELYAAENGGAIDPNAADFIGSLPANFAGDTVTQAFDSFWNSGIGDLSGFLQVPLTFLDLTP
jgi:hypothetical protein